jgi:hypothetical protein
MEYGLAPICLLFLDFTVSRINNLSILNIGLAL